MIQWIAGYLFLWQDDRMKKRISWTIFFFAFLGYSIYSFTFEPITMDFAPDGRESRKTFRVENPGDSAIAIQISMVTREMDIDGKESY